MFKNGWQKIINRMNAHHSKQHPVDDLLPTVLEHYHQLDIRCLWGLE
jgi:hypothetical protein